MPGFSLQSLTFSPQAVAEFLRNPPGRPVHSFLCLTAGTRKLEVHFRSLRDDADQTVI
jgi:hypothetical protein